MKGRVAGFGGTLRFLGPGEEHRIPLEVCPTSNVCTGAVESLAAHPLPDLLARGVVVTLGTDDPGLFGTSLNREHLLCHEHFGFGRAELADLARAGVEAAFCGFGTRDAVLSELAQVTHSATPRRTPAGTLNLLPRKFYYSTEVILNDRPGVERQLSLNNRDR